MLRRLVAMLLAGVLAIFSIGCAKQESPKGLPDFPKIPKGFESKPGYGGMGDKKPATEPAKTDTPPTEGAAPAGETTPATEPAKTDAPPTEGAAPAGDAGSGTEKTN